MNEILLKPFKKYASASVNISGSKSITNRAMLLALLKGGNLTLKGVLFSRDTLIMLDCLKTLGVDFEVDKDKFEVKMSVKAQSPIKKSAKLFMGNAGTCARFMTAFLATVENGEYAFDADEAMYRRPMAGLIDALKSQGAEFEFLKEENAFPFIMKTNGLKGGSLSLDARQSSQILSALLIAGVKAKKDLQINLVGETVSKPFVDMTFTMLEQFGFKCDRQTYTVEASTKLADEEVFEYEIEPDATSSSYFIALPIAVGGAVLIKNFAKCKLQGDVKFKDVLEASDLIKCSIVGEDLLVKASELNACANDLSFNFNDISDTFLTLAALSPIIGRQVYIEGIAHTRNQETDRVKAMATELKKFCKEVIEAQDSIKLIPYSKEELSAKLSKVIDVETYKDHRFAMSFAILASSDVLGKAWINILDPLCCGKTFANFFEVLDSVKKKSEDFRLVGIDGGAAVGKSSVSKECSRVLHFMHVDTGSHYRTLTYSLLESLVDISDENAVEKHLRDIDLSTSLNLNSARMVLNGRLIEDSLIRNKSVNEAVASVAALPKVREFLKNYQRSMADVAKDNNFGGLIMEGRDITSVIFPDAHVRVFLDADEQTRAKRRSNEGISDSISKRDNLDITRKTAPLVCLEGVNRIDTSYMTKEEVIDTTLALILK